MRMPASVVAAMTAIAILSGGGRGQQDAREANAASPASNFTPPAEPPTLPVVASGSDTGNADTVASDTSEINARSDEITAVRPKAKLTLDGEGLRFIDPVTGSSRLLAFGSPKAQLLSALEPMLGKPFQGRNADCGADFANWTGGLSLVITNGKLAGWSVADRAGSGLTTMAGVGPGSTRRELEAAYSATFEQTSLGTEFAAGGLNGLLGSRQPTARITYMWSGISCAAR